MTTDEIIAFTDGHPDQRSALEARARERGMSVEEFVEAHGVTADHLFGTLFYSLYGMTVGIERDGYTHT